MPCIYLLPAHIPNYNLKGQCWQNISSKADWGILWRWLLDSWHWSCFWIPATLYKQSTCPPLIEKLIWASHTQLTSHKPTIVPKQNIGALYNRTNLGAHTTNRGLAVDTCHLSGSRKCIYLGKEGHTFNFLKPISCQHWWLNISWARVWSDSGELPVRRFLRHSDWWGDISRAAVPYAVTRSDPPIYAVGQLSVVPVWHRRHQQKIKNCTHQPRKQATDWHQHKTIFKYIWTCIRTIKLFSISNLFNSLPRPAWCLSEEVICHYLKSLLNVTVSLYKAFWSC